MTNQSLLFHSGSGSGGLVFSGNHLGAALLLLRLVAQDCEEVEAKVQLVHAVACPEGCWGEKLDLVVGEVENGEVSQLCDVARDF